MAVRNRCRVDRLRDPRAYSFLHTGESLARDRGIRRRRGSAFAPARRRRRAHGTRIGAPAVARRRHDRPRREYNRPPHRKPQRRHRLALASGTIHAKTTSQPGVFVIDTPKARAIDLGCEYTLTIAPNGGGELHVIARMGRPHARLRTVARAARRVGDDRERRPLTVPVFDDASRAFHAAFASTTSPRSSPSPARAMRSHC